MKLLLLMMLPLAAAGCRGRDGSAASGVPSTQTIAPAAAKPAPNDTEAMTQTVDVEDSRSVAEGGVMTEAPKKATPAKKVAPAKKPKK